MWIWSQTSGDLEHEGASVATGYAGHEEGKNNPEMQEVPKVGPLPRGFYKIGAAEDNPLTGPLSMRLTATAPPPDWTGDADLGNLAWMYGRSSFLIHPDSIEHPGEASHGCIVPVRGAHGETGHQSRERIAGSGDDDLEVRR